MNKTKWIILISVVVVALAAVLLIVLLGDGAHNAPSGGETTEPDSQEIEVEMGFDADDEEITDNMIIDFNDLLAAAGK